MKRTTLAVLFFACLLAAAWAGHPKKGAAAPPAEHKIFEVTATSITLSFGSSGEVHETFQITDSTRITLEGIAVPARDLRAGMVAHVTAEADHRAVSIAARAAPAHPKKGRVG